MTISTPSIFLVGMMGAGKSTVGKELAVRVGYRFIDLDQWIVERSNESIARLFEQGEQYFRSKECEALRLLCSELHEKPAIIATGGGAPMDPSNRAEFDRAGLSVFLRVPVEELLQRLEKAEELDSRPKLRRSDDLQATIEGLLAQRISSYEASRISIDAVGDVKDIARKVLAAVERVQHAH